MANPSVSNSDDVGSSPAAPAIRNPIKFYLHLISWVHQNRCHRRQEAADFASWAYIHTNGFTTKEYKVSWLHSKFLSKHGEYTRGGLHRDVGTNCRKLKPWHKKSEEPKDILLMKNIEKNDENEILKRSIEGHDQTQIAKQIGTHTSYVNKKYWELVEKIRSQST